MAAPMSGLRYAQALASFPHSAAASWSFLSRHIPCAQSDIRTYSTDKEESPSISGKDNLDVKPTSDDADEMEPKVTLDRLLVLGGRGFIGAAVCKTALDMGLQVTSVSPSGSLSASKQEWVNRVEWVEGDAAESTSYAHVLPSVLGTVSCIGMRGRSEREIQAHVEAQRGAMRACAAMGVPRFVLLSQDIPSLSLIGDSKLLRSKVLAEDELRRSFGNGGTIARPSSVYGFRQPGQNGPAVRENAQLLINSIFRLLPLSQYFAHTSPAASSLFQPPLYVNTLARALVILATNPQAPRGGVLSTRMLSVVGDRGWKPVD